MQQNSKVEEKNLRLVETFEPNSVWRHFATVCSIPRGSGDEREIANIVVGLGKKYQSPDSDFGLMTRDVMNNVLIRIPASAGYENRPSVCLQSHLDMVCVKDKGVKEMFPLRLVLEADGFLKATGTTLGADNGIGAAMMMALLTDDSIPHGELELLFTTVEEKGLDGAKAFDYRLIKSRQVINLDSEEWGSIFIGCAGGFMAKGTFLPQYDAGIAPGKKWQIVLSGFKGGHSGLEIGSGRANAIVMLAKLLTEVAEHVHLIDFHGGHQINAIPIAASAIVQVTDEEYDDFLNAAMEAFKRLAAEYPEEEISFRCVKSTISDNAMDKYSMDAFLKIVLELPNGPLAMENENQALVRTSSNVSIVSCDEFGDKMTVQAFPRSSSPEDLAAMEDKIKRVFAQADSMVMFSSHFPPWKPDPTSPLLDRIKSMYRAQYGEDPKMATIHAGLECAVIQQHMPHAQIVSFGPTIYGAHTTQERVDVVTVNKAWNLLKAVLVS